MAKVEFAGLVPEYILNNATKIEEWLVNIVEERNHVLKRVNYEFLDDIAIQELNVSLLDHDYPTDIITLNHSRGSKLKVEVFLGQDTIEFNAKERGIPEMDEYMRVLAHGLLHCMGWDDQTDEDKRQMRLEEEKCLISRPK